MFINVSLEGQNPLNQFVSSWPPSVGDTEQDVFASLLGCKGKKDTLQEKKMFKAKYINFLVLKSFPYFNGKMYLEMSQVKTPDNIYLIKYLAKSAGN